MNLLAGARWLLTLGSRRASRLPAATPPTWAPHLASTRSRPSSSLRRSPNRSWATTPPAPPASSCACTGARPSRPAGPARRRRRGAHTSRISSGSCPSASPRHAWPRALQTTRVEPPGRAHAVVVAAVQVAVQPEVGARNQVVVGVAEARRAAALAVARVGAAQARREVSDGDGPLPVAAADASARPRARRGRRGLPRASPRRRGAGRRGSPASRAGNSRRRASPWPGPPRRTGRNRTSGSCRRSGCVGRGRRTTTTLSRSSSVMPSAAQRSRSAGQATSRSRPSNSWLPATNSTGCGQPAKRSSAAPGAVDVAGEHQQLGAGAGSGSNCSVSRCRSDSSWSRISARRGTTLTGAPAAPWQTLYFLPLPHGQGSLRPTLGASRRTVSTW